MEMAGNGRSASRPPRSATSIASGTGWAPTAAGWRRCGCSPTPRTSFCPRSTSPTEDLRHQLERSAILSTRYEPRATSPGRPLVISPPATWPRCARPALAWTSKPRSKSRSSSPTRSRTTKSSRRKRPVPASTTLTACTNWRSSGWSRWRWRPSSRSAGSSRLRSTGTRRSSPSTCRRRTDGSTTDSPSKQTPRRTSAAIPNG